VEEKFSSCFLLTLFALDKSWIFFLFFYSLFSLFVVQVFTFFVLSSIVNISTFAPS